MAISKEKKKAINSVLNGINKKFGEGTVKIVSEHMDELSIKFYPTPSLEVNEMLGGGIGIGKIIEIAGENSSGKTSLALETAAYNQKIASEKGEDFVIGFFETEQSWDADYAKMLGVDLDQCVYWDQKDYGAERGFDMLRSIVESGQFKMVIINSVAGLNPAKEREGEFQDQNVALNARLMSKACRVLTGLADKHKCSLVFINQTRVNIGQMYGDVNIATGGRAIPYYASQRIKMNKVKVMANDPINETDGVKINCSVVKNRFANGTNPYKKCTYYAIYGTGIDRLICIPDILERENIFRTAGSWYYWDDENGQPKTVEGVECKFRSRNVLLDTIRNNEAFRKIVENAINDKINLGKTKGTSMTVDEIDEAKKLEKEVEEVAVEV